MISADRLTQFLLIGAHGILLHRFRSFLTMLGVIFGVAAVIAMLAIGAGARDATLAQIEAYGADTLYVRAVKLIGDGLRDAKRAGSVGLSLEDGEQLRATFPFVRDVAPEALLDEKVAHAGREPKLNLVGIDGGFHRLSRHVAARGRLLDAGDVSEGRRVAVLAPAAARSLFLHEPAEGDWVRIGQDPYRVIGVLGTAREAAAGARGGGGGGGLAVRSRDVSRDVYIPITTALESFQKIRDASDSDKDPTYNRVKELIVQIESSGALAEAKRHVSKLLRRRHRGRDDFELIVPLELLEQSRKTQEIFNLVMALIASLSLLVGGIGIMNIMLASVTERTREIGVRRSLGASQQDILGQFLVEATLISVTGGLLGILGGVGIAQAVRLAVGWETRITAISVLLAFGVSVAVGLVFGYVPARRAAAMDPVTALRSE